MEKLFPAFTGIFEAFATPDGCKAEVRNTDTGKVVKRFKGETAWMDAERDAGDRNVEAQRA